MQVRVDRLVPYGYTDTVISTFHAFGDRVIREHALELGLPSEPRVLSRPETVIFLAERLFRLDLDEYRPLGNPTRFLDALATLFSRLKDEDVSPAAFAAHAARLVAEAEAATGRSRRASRSARRPAGRASWPAPTPATRSCSARPGRSTSATRWPSPCGSSASTRPRGPSCRPASATSSSTSSRT